MNFENFKNILNELKEKGYIQCELYEHHAVIYIKQQSDEKLVKLINDKIIKIFNKVDELCDYRMGYNHLYVFATTEILHNIIDQADNYKTLQRKINNAGISYVYAGIDGSGEDTHIDLRTRNDHSLICREYDFHKGILRIIDATKSDSTYIEYGHWVQTTKCKEYETKKMNCKEIQINEDFNEILAKYE